MAKPYPWYFTIDGRPVEVVGANDVRAMDPATGIMVPDGSYAERIARGGPGVVALSRDRYIERLDLLRQPILERYASTPLTWERTGDGELPYRVVVDGHELVIRVGEFPEEPLYLLRVDGQEEYAIDDWPAAWKKPWPPRP
jgi:hypothetical protein